MSLNRLLFSVVIAGYLVFTDQPGAEAGLVYIGCYVVFTMATLVSVVMDGRQNNLRRVVALAGDFATVGFEMHTCNATTAVFLPLYLWVILGNGFRFGLRFLLVSSAAAIVSFSAMAATTPFWRANVTLTLGFLVGLVVLPAYVATLISKLSKTADRLSRASEEAQSANQAKSMFLASMSHELRTPLHTITNAAALLGDTRLDASQHELIATLATSARHLLGLIGNVLDLSAMEANGPRIERAATDVTELMLEARSMVRLASDEKGLDLRLQVSPALPAALVIDRRLVLQILTNLLSNALKFTQVGHITLAVLPGPHDDTVRFEVADTGIGIAQGALASIWDSFAQADSTILDRFGGTGLGLAIVRQLVTSLGGKMGVNSEPGVGSMFWVILPAPRGEGRAAGAPRHEAARTELVVVADDSEADLEGLLAGIDADVSRVASLAEAIARTTLARRSAAASYILAAQETIERSAPTPSTLRSLRDLGCILLASGQEEADRGRSELGFQSWITRTGTPEDSRSALRIVAAIAHGVEVLRPQQEQHHVRGLRILVADDNQVNRKIMEKILDQAGHSTVLVCDGHQALDALGEGSFDLVLMDANMPEMNGLEATKMFRFMEPAGRRTPVIALTADATADMADRCREAGMDLVVTKPVDAARIHDIIASMMATAPEAAGAKEGRAEKRPRPPYDVVLPVLDRAQQESLRTLGGEEFLQDCCERFAADAAGLLGNLRSAAQSADLVAYRDSAHAIRSSGANVGAVAICEFALAGERLDARDLHTDGVRVAARLEIEVRRLLKEMEGGDNLPRRDEPAALR